MRNLNNNGSTNCRRLLSLSYAFLTVITFLCVNYYWKDILAGYNHSSMAAVSKTFKTSNSANGTAAATSDAKELLAVIDESKSDTSTSSTTIVIEDGENDSNSGSSNHDDENIDNGEDDAAVIVKVNFTKDLNVVMPTRNMRHDNGTFIGASEWYRYWTMTATNNKKQYNISTVSSSTSSQSNNNKFIIDHSHDNYILSRVKLQSNGAYRHIMGMKTRYETVGAIPDYRARGLGWIEHRLGMILSVIVAGGVVEENEDDTDVGGEEEELNNTAGGNRATPTALSSGNVSIFIVDTVGDMKCGGNYDHSNNASDDWMDYHPPLTMWVRANGPEIFAGTAVPHVFVPSGSSSSPNDRSRCAWRYEFQTQKAGVYSIYVKVLTFNGFADPHEDLCKVRTIEWQKTTGNNLTDDTQMQQAISRDLAQKGNFAHHRGIMAFKNYNKIPTCCEACTRARGCKMWSIPGEIDECELYFDKIEDDVDFWDDDKGIHLGRESNYSYASQNVSDFPVVRRRRILSLALNDKNVQRKLAMKRDEVNLFPKWPGFGVPDSYGYPRDEPSADFIGCGWSCLKSFESPCHYPSDDLIFGSGKRINITVGSNQVDVELTFSKENEKRACSLEDESFGNGRWVKYPFPDDSICMPVQRDNGNRSFKTYKPEYNGTLMPPYCWHRDNIDQCCNDCAERGCRFIVNHRWVSDLRRDGMWFGKWENFNCYWKDLSSVEIQQCIIDKNISNIVLKGKSIKQTLDTYITDKLNGLKMVEDTSKSRFIILDTLAMPHVVWHQTIEEFGKELDTYQDVDNETSEYYFITGFYYSSEREPHVTADRSLKFSNLAWEKLTPKGYKMINAFDVTAAFTFDSDAQNDGLHIIGPPIRAILTKFFHHLCHIG